MGLNQLMQALETACVNLDSERASPDWQPLFNLWLENLQKQYNPRAEPEAMTGTQLLGVVVCVTMSRAAWHADFEVEKDFCVLQVVFELPLPVWSLRAELQLH